MRPYGGTILDVHAFTKDGAMKGTLLSCVLWTWVTLSGGAAMAVAQGEGRPDQLDVVVTSAEGVIKASPDRAFVMLAVEVRARQPRDAQRQNAETMTAVQQKLAAAGIPADAVRTVGIDLSPEFDYASGKQQLRGYLARNTIEVRVEPLEKLGEVIDASVATGATNVAGVRFDVKRRADLEREALKLAVEQARARAEAAAAGAGRQVGRVLRIDDGGVVPVPGPRPMAMARMAEAADMSTPVAPGEIEIRAHVTLTSSMR
jgi:hypothetical protein